MLAVEELVFGFDLDLPAFGMDLFDLDLVEVDLAIGDEEGIK